MPTLYDPLTAAYKQVCPSCGYTEYWTLREYIHRRCPNCRYEYSHEEAVRAMARNVGGIDQGTTTYWANSGQMAVAARAVPPQTQQPRQEPSVKTFFLWLTIQCVFARVLIGMTLGMWSSLKISPDYLGYFILPASIICLAEAVTSAIVVYPLVTGQYIKK